MNERRMTMKENNDDDELMDTLLCEKTGTDFGRSRDAAPLVLPEGRLFGTSDMRLVRSTMPVLLQRIPSRPKAGGGVIKQCR